MSMLFLLLGGNMGDKQAVFSLAGKMAEARVGKLVNKSAIYETEPWGFDSKDLFWNQVLQLETTLAPDEVLKETQKIEHELGRTRHDKQYSSRIIDLDLLFYDGLIVNTDNLQIPHPRIGERRFVLIPLAEIAPEFVHPKAQKSVSTLLAECPDRLLVKRLSLR